MIKKNIQLRVALVLFTAMGSISTVQSTGYYGPTPMMQPMPGQMGNNPQKKQIKNQIKPQVKAQFYRQNPRATDKDWDRYWDHYWDNYKKQNRLKD